MMRVSSLSISLPMLQLLLLNYKNTIVAATLPPSSPLASPVFHKAISHPSTDYEFVSCHSPKSLVCVAQILGDLRGGGGDYDVDDESYDEYDSEEEDLEEDRNRGPKNSVREPYRSRPRPGINPKYSRRQQGGNRKLPPSSLSSATNAASAATKLATKSLSATGSLAWKALVKTPGKLAFHVIRPKHVDLVETFGLWRLDQQVVEKSNRRGDDQRTIASVATIEFVRPPLPPRGERGRSGRGSGRGSGPPRPPMVVVRHSKGESKDGEDGGEKEIVYRAPYTFIRKNKYLKGASLSSFQTSFVAPAFLVGENQTRLYGYKGTWQRKLADKSVIKLKGKIYQVHKQKFGKKRGEYVYGPAVGTFVMRRRILMSEEECDDIDESEFDESDDDEFDYDDDEEYDDDIEEYIEVEDDE